MMRINTPMLLRAAVLYSLCLPLHAHHSALVFETSTPIVVEGRIAEVTFANPHSAIFVDVVEVGAQPVRWAVENSGTLAMTRQRGFDETSLQVGEPIVVCGYAPKSSTRAGEEGAAGNTQESVPSWWEGASKVITGRLLILESGAAEHWSHYGPLDVCQALVGAK